MGPGREDLEEKSSFAGPETELLTLLKIPVESEADALLAAGAPL